MCHFITATLPTNAIVKSVAAIFDAHKLAFREISNSSIAAFTGPDEMQILTTTGHCDCGTVLGSLNCPDKTEQLSLNRELDRLRKKRWSEARIQRWIEEKERTKEKHAREDANQARTGTPLAAEWISFISDVLRSGQTQSIGLLLHQYRGGIESERIKVLDRKRVILTGLTPAVLMEMKEDVLYEFLP